MTDTDELEATDQPAPAVEDAPTHVLCTHDGVDGVWPIPVTALGSTLPGWTPVKDDPTKDTPRGGAATTTEKE